jgi:hypothetical protein
MLSPAERKPQINFQVEAPLKSLYDVARRAGGYNVTRLCAAGLLYLLENPAVQSEALNRLGEFYRDYDRADPEQLRAFVQGAKDALRRAAPGSRPKPRPAPGTRATRRERP